MGLAQGPNLDHWLLLTWPVSRMVPKRRHLSCLSILTYSVNDLFRSPLSSVRALELLARGEGRITLLLGFRV